MATSRVDYPEESRPPEDPVKRRCSDNSRYNYKYYPTTNPRCSMGALSLPPGILLSASGFGTPEVNRNYGEPNGNAGEDVNCNRIEEGGTGEGGIVMSPRRVTKSNSCREACVDKAQASSQTKRPASLPPEQYRKRSSYHRDVEEALSSLLWQPYEYRSNRSDSSDTLSSTLSSASSSASLSLDSAARGMMQSFTDEFLNMTTSLPPQQRCGNNADPNLSSQMVSNLMALKSTTVGAPSAQSSRSVGSRGRDGGSAASQVDWERSRECAFETRSACGQCNPVLPTSNASLPLPLPLSLPLPPSHPRPVPCADVFTNTVLTCVRDVKVLSAVVDDMRVEIPGPGAQPPEGATRKPPDVLPHVVAQPTNPARNGAAATATAAVSSVSLPIVQAGDPTTRTVFMQQPTTARCTVNTISSDMIPSNITSVVSANVVGLPVHSRSGSNLSNGRADAVLPTHPRSVSETTTNVFVQHQLGNHFRSISNLATQTPGAIPVHPRQNSSGSLPPRGASEPPINITHCSESSEPRSLLVPASGTDLNIQVRSNSETKIQEDSAQTRVPSLPNVSNVNVNFYRAVPVNVVSSVPTIQCLNSIEDTVNNVSNVHIVQAMPTTIPSVSISQTTEAPSFEVRTRTFTSTEAQTDDTTVGALVTPTPVPQPSVQTTREQRRRERRERRHQRRINSTSHQHPQPQWPQSSNDRLPDLLNSHLPPPYTTLPSNLPTPVTTIVPPIVPNPTPNPIPFHPGVVPGQVPLVPGQVPLVPGPPPVPSPSGFRFPFPSAAGFRRCRSRLGPRYTEEQPKSCCGLLVSRPGSLRWFIALIALVAVCCVLVGTVLGAMRPAGRDHLTVSLLMIGVGIVLVTVSGVAWRLTSHDAPSCRAMLGLESSESADICTRRFVPRLPPSYGRPHHPYAAMIYPEFQYRPPPPSYQASMQEYRLRLLLLDRGTTPQIQNAQHAVSPPPTYRSHAGSLLRAPLSSRRDATQSEYSCPPSYRSRSSSNRQAGNDTVVHSREQSLTLSESNQDDSVVNVVNILTNQEDEITLDNMALDSLKLAPDSDNLTPLRMLLKSSSGSDLVDTTTKDGNLVTIVQKADQNPVIVTVSGSQMSTTNPEVGSSNQIPSEMEILAHL